MGLTEQIAQDRAAHCRTSLFGATVTSWKVDGQEKLFLSSKSQLDASKPVSPGAIPEVGAAAYSYVVLSSTNSMRRSEAEYLSVS